MTPLTEGFSKVVTYASLVYRFWLARPCTVSVYERVGAPVQVNSLMMLARCPMVPCGACSCVCLRLLCEREYVTHHLLLWMLAIHTRECWAYKSQAIALQE